MGIFWPKATIVDGTMTANQRLQTYSGFTNCVAALNQFKIWEEEYGYNLKEMLIDVYDENGVAERVIKVKRNYVIVDDNYKETNNA